MEKVYTVKVQYDCNNVYATRWYNEKGELHREDGPAVEWTNGDKHWYINGKTHREDGPAVEYHEGFKKWFLNGRLHRENGPAIEDANGDKEWYLNGKRHREDGPAVEYASGLKQYFIKGNFLSEEDFNKLTRKQEPSCEGKIVEIDGKKYKLTLV